jgi:hypothetical protein
MQWKPIREPGWWIDLTLFLCCLAALSFFFGFVVGLYVECGK